MHTFASPFFIHIRHSKQSLRHSLKALRRQLPLSRKDQARDSLFDFFKKRIPPNFYTLSFASFGDEIDMWPLNHYLLSKGRLLLPKVSGQELKIFHVRDFQRDLIFSKLGLLEPNEELCEPFNFDSSMVVLVPGLGFDPFNHRLGYGRGYYDRFLKIHSLLPSWGIGFKEQFLSHAIPTLPSDIPLKAVHLF